VASRRSRAAPLDRASPWGPRHGPPNPPAFGASRRSRAAPLDRASPWGPRHGPQTPPPSERPGEAVPLLWIAPARGGPDLAPQPPPLRAPRRSPVAPLTPGATRPRWRPRALHRVAGP